MATPTNNSGKLRVDGAGASSTTQVGFTFTAGRSAVLTLSHYHGSNGRVAGVTIGGTAAQRRIRADSEEQWSVDIWDVFNMAGGTDEIVITYSDASGAGNYCSMAVTEWAAGVLIEPDEGTENADEDIFSATPTVSTAQATSQDETLVFAVMCNARFDSNLGFVHPDGWNLLFAEQDSRNHQGGCAAYVEESTTGVKTAVFAQDGGIAKSFACIAAYKLGDGDIAGVDGTLEALESGSDTFAATGGVGSNGLRFTLRDTDTGALAADLEDLILSVRANSNDEEVLYSSEEGTTDEDGVGEIMSTDIGDIGDYVYLTVEKADHSIVATYRLQVIDLTA